MKHILREAEKLIFPILLVLGGAYTLGYYNSMSVLGEDQPMEMLVGGITLILAGVIMALIFFKVTQNKFLNIILSTVMVLCSVYFTYKVFNTIFSEDAHRETRDINQKATIQRLKDLRFAMEKYKSYNKVYPNNYDSLEQFLKEDNIPVPYRNGNVLENKFFQENNLVSKRNEYIISKKDLADMGLTEEQAVANNYEIRDTTYTSHEDKYFSDAFREKKKLPKVKIDQLSFNPWSGERFELEYRLQANYNPKSKRPQEVYVQITDPTPYRVDQNDIVTKDTLSFGKLDIDLLDGNWSE